MYFAKENQRLPIGVDSSLMTIADRKLLRTQTKEIKYLKEMIKDKNFRILLSDEKINVFNKNILKSATDPYEFYDHLDLSDDSSHAFYMGVELARAQIALQLGKNYNQDNELKWGIASKKQDVDLENRPKLKSTQKK